MSPLQKGIVVVALFSLSFILWMGGTHDPSAVMLGSLVSLPVALAAVVVKGHLLPSTTNLGKIKALRLGALLWVGGCCILMIFFNLPIDDVISGVLMSITAVLLVYWLEFVPRKTT